MESKKRMKQNRQLFLEICVCASSEVLFDPRIPNEIAIRSLEVIESSLYHMTNTPSRFRHSTVNALFMVMEEYGYGIN
jgi:hypothetical protein